MVLVAGEGERPARGSGKHIHHLEAMSDSEEELEVGGGGQEEEEEEEVRKRLVRQGRGEGVAVFAGHFHGVGARLVGVVAGRAFST
jgi:hypothetical protein